MKGGPSPVMRQRLSVCLEIFVRAAASSTVNRTWIVMVVASSRNPTLSKQRTGEALKLFRRNLRSAARPSTLGSSEPNCFRSVSRRCRAWPCVTAPVAPNVALRFRPALETSPFTRVALGCNLTAQARVKALSSASLDQPPMSDRAAPTSRHRCVLMQHLASAHGPLALKAVRERARRP